MKRLKNAMRKLQASNSDEKELYKEMTQEVLKLGQDLEYVNAIYGSKFLPEKKKLLYRKEVRAKIPGHKLGKANTGSLQEK